MRPTPKAVPVWTAIILTFLASACEPWGDLDIHVTGVSLDVTSTVITVGETLLLSATLTPAAPVNSGVTWESSNPAIAEISDTGTITGKAAGTVTITVHTLDQDKEASCTVQVVAVETVDFEDTGTGWIRFMTNDTAKCGYEFYQSYTSSYSTSSTITATTRKTSGAATGYWGVVYAYTGTNNTYATVIRQDGYYCQFKVVSGTTTIIKSWTYSSYINKGTGVNNTISVTLSGTSYYLYLNGSYIRSFTRDSTLGTTGYCGFLTDVQDSDTEDFPVTPVDILFTMSSPLTLP